MPIKTTDLVRALRLVVPNVETRSTIPILSQVLIRGMPENKIKLTGTDLDRQLDVVIDGSIDADALMLDMPGEVCNAIRIVGAEETTITVAKVTTVENGKDVTRNTVTIRSGEFVGEFQGYPVEDFPNQLDGIDSVFRSTVGTDFFKSLRQISGAVSTEETRYYLNGVYLDKIDDTWGYAMVATDGHRLYTKDLAIPDGIGEFTPTIIPSRAIQSLFNLAARLGNSSVAMSIGRHVRRNSGGDLSPPTGRANELMQFHTEIDGMSVTLTTKSIDGTYPDYKRVIPKAEGKTAMFKTADLRRVVSALCSGHTKKSRHALALEFKDGALKIVTQWGYNAHKTALRVPFEGEVPGAGLIIGFNSGYLRDVLKAVNGADEFSMLLSDATSPTIVRGKGMDDFKAILMPMRV